MTGSLAWPPTKEDLERLYLVEHMSAAKIAREYGLRYKTPKVAESVVLYQLKRNGIKRRDAAEHIRKVNEEMVDEWVRRYQSGESLKQIAAAKVDSVTVWLHLKKRGVQLRDRIEAQIKAVSKYEKKPFSGDKLEKAYLMGLRYGDLHVVKHGRAVRLRVSTTHPAMASLFELVFSSHGHVSRYPRRAKLVGYEWTLECDLDSSFGFLLHKPSIAELEGLSREEGLAFLAGLFDAEGTTYLHRKRGWCNPEVAFANTEEPLLEFVLKCLNRLGYYSKVEFTDQPTERMGVSGPSRIGHLRVWRFNDVQDLLQLLPIRHPERLEKRQLVLSAIYRGNKADNLALLEKWTALKDRIKTEREAFIESARDAIEGSDNKRTIL